MSARIKYKHLKAQVQKLESILEGFESNEQETIKALNKLVKFLEEDRERLKNELSQRAKIETVDVTAPITARSEQAQEVLNDKALEVTPEIPQAPKNKIVTSPPEAPKITKIPKQKKVQPKATIPKTSSGKYFEVSNAAIWKVKYVQGEVENNLRFSEIKNKQTKGELSEEVLLKKPGTQWKRIRDIFEFNTEVFAKKVNGKFKLLVKRESIRVPVSENVTILGLDVSALCSDISYGGCYLESYELKSNMLKIGDELEFEFSSKAHEGLKIKAVVRNIKEDSALGIGLKFVSMDQKTKEKLGEIFKTFVNKLNEAA